MDGHGNHGLDAETFLRACGSGCSESDKWTGLLARTVFERFRDLRIDGRSPPGRRRGEFGPSMLIGTFPSASGSQDRPATIDRNSKIEDRSSTSSSSARGRSFLEWPGSLDPCFQNQRWACRSSSARMRSVKSCGADVLDEIAEALNTGWRRVDALHRSVRKNDAVIQLIVHPLTSGLLMISATVLGLR